MFRIKLIRKIISLKKKGNIYYENEKVENLYLF